MLTKVMRSVFVLCIVAACYHDPAPAPVVTPLARVPRVDAAAYDPLGYLPIDAEVVLSIDASQLRASGLWKALEPVLSAKAGDVLARFHAQCGVDPLRSIKHLAMGFRGLEDTPGPSGVFVMRGLDRKAMMSCMGRLVGTDARVTIVNGVVAVKAAAGEHPAAFTFTSASTLVAVISPTASPEELAAVIARGTPLRGSPVFVELFTQIQAQSTAWFILNGTSKVFDKMSALGFRPKALTGAVQLAAGLTGTARMRLDSADGARNLAGLGQGQLGPLKALVDEIELSSEDADVVLRVVMSQGQLEAVAGILGVLPAGP